MISSFLSGLSFKAYLAVIGALLGVLATIGTLYYFVSSENDTLKKDIQSYELALTASVKISNNNEKEFQEYKLKNEETIQILNESFKKELEREKEFSTKKGEINNVKESDDGTNANVIINTLQWLHEKTVSANRSQDNKE